MSNKNLKIVFMGTPDFAIPTMEALCENYTVVSVVTKVDKPKGRGNKMASPPVKDLAIAKGIPVLQPETVKTEEFVKELKSFGADLFVTCAYGKILPQAVLDIPPMGTINVHASLLPKYRGSAPLWHMVINGEKEVGVTTMLTDIGMDTGDMLLKYSMPLGEDTTMGEVHDMLSKAGGKLIVDTIEGILQGTITPVPQQDEEATHAPMISKEDGVINWSKPASAIHNLVRGMNPFPAASTTKDGEVLKIYATKPDMDASTGDKAPGTVIKTGDGIWVTTGQGVIVIKELQGQGAKRMDAKAYLNGHPIKEGTVLGK